MNLTEEKMKLVGIYNAIQEKIDAYGLNDVVIDSGPFKQLCSKKQQIEIEIKELNKLLDIKDE